MECLRITHLFSDLDQKTNEDMKQELKLVVYVRR